MTAERACSCCARARGGDDDCGARLQLLRELRVAMRLAEEERLLVEPALVERAWPG